MQPKGSADNSGGAESLRTVGRQISASVPGGWDIPGFDGGAPGHDVPRGPRSHGARDRRAGAALRVHEALEAPPMLSLSAFCESTWLSSPAAPSGMELLERLGIARELIAKRRERLFVYERYLAVLNEGT